MGSTMLSAQGAYQLYIDGQWVGNSSGKTFAVYDPSTEEVIAEVPDCSSMRASSTAAAALR